MGPCFVAPTSGIIMYTVVIALVILEQPAAAIYSSTLSPYLTVYIGGLLQCI